MNDRKLHHNSLEKARREDIKNGFSSLRDCIPVFRVEKNASRRKVLVACRQYIDQLQKENEIFKNALEKMEHENKQLKALVSSMINPTKLIIPDNLTFESDSDIFDDNGSRKKTEQIGTNCYTNHNILEYSGNSNNSCSPETSQAGHNNVLHNLVYNIHIKSEASGNGDTTGSDTSDLTDFNVANEEKYNQPIGSLTYHSNDYNSTIEPLSIDAMAMPSCGAYLNSNY